MKWVEFEKGDWWRGLEDPRLHGQPRYPERTDHRGLLLFEGILLAFFLAAIALTWRDF